MGRLEPRSRTRRPPAVVATVATLAFLGAMALGGGVEMLVFRHGGTYLPAERLDHIPLVDSYLLPGLVLATLFGVGSLVTAAGMARRSPLRVLAPVERRTRRHWSWGATVALGAAFASWLVLELLLLGGPAAEDSVAEQVTSAVTYAVFGSIALALSVLPHRPTVRRYLRLADTERRPPGPGSPGPRPR